MNTTKLTNIELFVIQTVKEKRTEKGYSQAYLADLLEVTNGFVGKVESSNYPAKYNLNHIDKLALIFNCSPQEFLPKKHINYVE